jgi:hypothetical protein
MHRKVYEIELSTDDADPILYLDQRLPFQARSERIQIHVDQIDTVVRWLQEAKELLGVRGESG